MSVPLHCDLTAVERTARLGAQTVGGGEEPEFASGDDGYPLHPLLSAQDNPDVRSANEAASTAVERPARPGAQTALQPRLSSQDNPDVRSANEAASTAVERPARPGAQTVGGGE